MPLTEHEIERRLKRNESDIIEIYGICTDIQRVVRAHDRRFDALDVRLDAMDARFDAIDAKFDAMDAKFDEVHAKFDAMDTKFDEVLRRLPES